jgi:hypothetical protein
LKTIGTTLLCALTALALVGSPALAKKKAPSVSCKQIKDAMTAGKTAEEVEKDLNVSASRVKSCTTPSTKHHKTTHKASS